MASLPEEFLRQLDALGHDAYRRLPDAVVQGQPPVSVRLNPAKAGANPFPDDGVVAWAPHGLYLASRPDFTLDPRLHQGLYYVQEASSMAIGSATSHAAELLAIEGRPMTVLDACAAPGGKTTVAIDALPADTFVVANEYDPRRAQVLAENIAKWGSDAFVTRSDSSKKTFPDGFFDLILADVPCSGEGMMRKDPFAIEQWTPRLVDECAKRQLGIVDTLWDALAPGGILVYSTCTFNLAENEEIVQHLISDYSAEPLEIPVAPEGILGAMGGYKFPALRFVPGTVRGEGLFMAMVRKPGRLPKATSSKDTRPNKKKAQGLPFALGDILAGEYSLASDSPLRAVRASHMPLYNHLAAKVTPLSAGIELGELKGRDFIPSQQLALSRAYRRGAFPEAEVDHDTALAYLRREALSLPEDTPRGIVLLTHGGWPLGWAKNIGKRANNLYPDSWRIRKL